MSLNRIKELSGIKNISEAKVDMGELIDNFLDVNKIYSFDGSSGVRKFEKLTQALDSSYRDVNSFLADNPGAFEALLAWIRSSNVREWAENLEQYASE